MSEHTLTPWVYRPHHHDDWGWIRGPKTEDEEIGPLVALARSGKHETLASLDEHRSNKTDPYWINAEFIIRAVNSHDHLVGLLNEVLDSGNLPNKLALKIMATLKGAGR